MTAIEERYRRAESLLDEAVADLVLNETIVPMWIGQGPRFWYRRQLAEGWQFLLVDELGTAEPAFDHPAVAGLLGRRLGQAAMPSRLDVVAIDPGHSVTVRVGGAQWRLEARSGMIEPVDTPAPLDGYLLSPDRTQGVRREGHDVLLRGFAEDREIRLTEDGAEHFAWGSVPDAWLGSVAQQRESPTTSPFGWHWSPDGHYLVGGRVDERHIEPYPLLESAPIGGGVRPRVWEIRQPLVGQSPGLFEAAVFNSATGRRVHLDLSDSLRQALHQIEPLGWSVDGEHFWFTAVDYQERAAYLLEAGASDGRIRIVIEERPEGFVNLNPLLYNLANVRIICGGREAIWYSERSGWGHLYRYDLDTGACLGAITAGDWLVRDILHIDDARQRLFVTVGGLAPGDPYYRQVLRADFDGSDMVLLTPEDADHLFDGLPAAMFSAIHKTAKPPSLFSPDGSRFVDSWSTVTEPGETVLRSTGDGTIIARLETADASALFARGWRPPEPFEALAADGRTILHGVLYHPEAQDEKALPIIDALYCGPQLVTTPHNFKAARMVLRGGYGRTALAALGFAVMVIDARGTPLRSKAFQDVGYGCFADSALDDHVAVLHQLAGRNRSIDLTRTGVIGHSFGGYVAARAILRHPELFKVAVASAGSHNLHGMYKDVQMYLPPPDYGKGRTMAPDGIVAPRNFVPMDNAHLAAALVGKLLLAYGDLDENAYPAVTLQLVAALIDENRDFDLLCLPGRTHHFKNEPYFVRRYWDYFITHLRGEAPPDNFPLRRSR